MWAILGVIAIVITVINLSLYAAGKDYKLSMAPGITSDKAAQSSTFTHRVR